jgi:hypothetical protein
MSREIDLDDPDSWTDEDVQYLGDRQQLPGEMQQKWDESVLKEGHPGLPEETPLEDQAHTGDANTAGISKEEHERRTAALAEEEDEGLSAPYDDYTNNELRAELARRELDVSGVKDDLIARLNEDDENEE